MDAIDRQILQELAKDSSKSLNELAGLVGVPSSTLHQKIKKFEAKGLITGIER
jgi:Transcriptional regulators